MDSTNPNHAKRWLILAVLGMAQLMVVLDATIVNIALPSAQLDLAFSDGSRQWVITGYALAFGSLLLLGGRISDRFGRKRVLIAGLAGFAVASAIGGMASSFGMLIAARALQGVFAALLAPAALSTLTTTFTDDSERNKAFGVYGAIAGTGGGIGLLLGGVLTEYLSWRWAMYVNLLIAVPAMLGAIALLADTRDAGDMSIDLRGAVTATLGLFALVYGFSSAESSGWGATVTLIMFAASAVLLTVFVSLQRRGEDPLLPLRVVLDRDRGGAYLSMAIAGAGMFGVFLFLTYYLQQTLGFTPIETGVGFLPMILSVIVSAALVSAKLLDRFGPRSLISIGMTVAAVSMVSLTAVSVDSAYATHVLPGLIGSGIGMGLIFAPSMATATYGVAPREAGVASAMVNTAQQVGGSIGTALLSTIAASAASSFAAGSADPATLANAAVHSYTTAFWYSAGLFAIGAALAFTMLRPQGTREVTEDTGASVFAH